MACQVPQRVRDIVCRAYFHVHPPRAKQWSSAPAQISFCRSDKDVFQAAGLVAVAPDLFTGIADILSPAIGFFDLQQD